MSTPAIILPAPKLPFFTRLKNWVVTHFSKAPALEVQVSSVANYIVPFVEEIDTLVDPELAPVVNPVLDKIKTGLGAMATTITDSSAAGKANLQSILSSINTNADALLTSFQVKDAATQDRVKAIVQLIQGETSAIAAEVGTAKA